MQRPIPLSDSALDTVFELPARSMSTSVTRSCEPSMPSWSTIMARSATAWSTRHAGPRRNNFPHRPRVLGYRQSRATPW